MQVTFLAQIKDLSIKTCVSGDKTTRIVLEQEAVDVDTLAYLAALQHCEKNESRELRVVIADEIA